MSSANVQPPLKRRGIRPIALSLGLGAVGGAVFTFLRVPLPWMLGPLIVNIVAAVRGWPVLVPHWVRVVMISGVGVFLGGSFSPELAARAGTLVLSLSLMLVFVPLVTWLSSEYFRRVAGFDRTTALFSGAPGTITAMIIIGGDAGGDERLLTLTQGIRVVLVVILMPLVVTAFMAGTPDAVTLVEGGPLSVCDVALLLASAAAGVGTAFYFNLPSAALSLPMIVSALLYVTGTVHYRPPEELLWVTLWILGSAVGSRFSTVSRRMFFHGVTHAIAATAIVIAVSALFAIPASWLTGSRYLTALLSFTPGGVAEMSLIALSFGIDPAVVAVHHLTRIAILLVAVPFAAKILLPNGPRPEI